MNVSKVKAAIDNAQKELNTEIDAAFKARKLNVVRTLDLASKALERAAGHLDTAVEQNGKKAKTSEGDGK